MKIDGANNINNIPKINNIPNKTIPEVNKVNPHIGTERNPGAIYQESRQADKFQTYNIETIEKLIKESENVYAQLKEIVEDMLIDQKALSNMFNKSKPINGSDILKPASTLNPNNPLNPSSQVELTEELMGQIKDLIESQGKLGFETMSEKIFDIVKNASGGDRVKIDILMELIDEVFKESQVKFGGLSDLSTKTYDKIMEKLDSLLSPENIKNLPENLKTELKTIIEGMLTKQAKAVELLNLAGKENLDNPLLTEIKDMIEPEGRLGDESMSEKISDLVKASTEGDTEKVDSLIKEIQRTFEDAEKTLGKLPEISTKTYDRTIEKLENLLPVNPSKIIPESVKLELGQMIEETISSQVKTLALIKGVSVSGLNLNEATITEAKSLIRPDGLYGVIVMSTQIVKFAKESAGGDAEKLSDIINQIKKNFSEVKNTLGDLPDITEETYEMIIKKLEEDLLELSNKGLKTFDKFMSMLEWFRERNIPIQRYALVAGGGALLYYGIRILL